MDIFDFLTMLGGLSLFLFGMSVMGQGLERAAGSKLKTILERLTSRAFSWAWWSPRSSSPPPPPQ